MLEKPSGCFLCDGKGFFECDNRTEVCCICRSHERELIARQTNVLPSIDTFFTQLASPVDTPLFQYPPDLLVIHSAESHPNVAEYLHSLEDGRLVSCHLAWSENEANFVQMLPFNRVAWHCGGSVFQGKGHVNFRSVGIELPGPWDMIRDEEQKHKFRVSVMRLKSLLPTIKLAARHCDIDAKKRDPGPGWGWDWLQGIELATPFRQSQKVL